MRAAAAWTICGVSVEHYENFPVASWLCPAPLRGTVAAIYWFARTADDIADEGDASPAQRLADLSAFRADLIAVHAGDSPSSRWQTVFAPLGAAIARHRLPVKLLDDLLRAFEQDIVKTRYRDRTEVLDYCSRSANPVGRLLLHLYGVDDAESLAQSDAICTALQLINFWQDLGIDTARDRLYLPLTDIASHGLSVEGLMARQDSPAVRGLIAEMNSWARALMLQGAPLVHRVAGRAGWELRLVVQGGLRIAEKITLLDHATLLQRPRIGKADAPLLLWRAARMHPPTTTLTRRAT